MNKKIQLFVLLGFSIIVIGNGCTFSVSNENTSQPTPSTTTTGNPTSTPTVTEDNVDVETEAEKNARIIISQRATEVIAALKDNDLSRLSGYVHPEKGVRFSPYVYVKKDSDRVFKADKIKNLLEDKTVYTWGTADGSGFPIELTPGEYFKQFVYSHDFATVEKITYNNTFNYNTKEVLATYPDSIIAEYHYPGTDPKFAGMDWQTLRLVFEKFNGVWYLVGIVNDEWMI